MKINDIDSIDMMFLFTFFILAMIVFLMGLGSALNAGENLCNCQKAQIEEVEEKRYE